MKHQLFLKGEREEGREGETEKDQEIEIESERERQKGRKGAERQDVFRKPYGKRKAAAHSRKRYCTCIIWLEPELFPSLGFNFSSVF